ncbi:hypothetical protein AB7V66_21485 [Providencia rettgeri]
MDKSRKLFEEWFKKEYPLIESQPENTLLQSVKRQCHKAWQASREKLEIELPEFKSRSNDMYYDGFHSCLGDIREELISNGVKMKNE